MIFLKKLECNDLHKGSPTQGIFDAGSYQFMSNFCPNILFMSNIHNGAIFFMNKVHNSFVIKL